ncbi:MAG: cation transporter [Microgenomates group bacterium]|nr:cation transporter [Microgenomates group bacterium]
MIKKAFAINGMHCASCVYVNEQALKKIPGVIDAVVNLANSKATIIAKREIDFDQIKKAVENVGYQVIFEEEKDEDLEDKIKKEKEKELKKLKTKSFISLFFVFFLVWATFPYLSSTSPTIFKNFYFQFISASIVQFWVGGEFYKNTISALKHRQANMDTLVVLGTTVAYIYSTILVFFPKLFLGLKTELTLYFDVSVVIIALVFLGRYLEAKAKTKTNEALKKLMELQAKEANLIIKN